jgi:predicted nucleotidyltransferase
MSINNKLTDFAQRELVLSRDDTERDKIVASLQHLENVLKNKLNTEIREFVRFGSFTRNTILPRRYDSKSDVDLMVVFDTSSGRKTPGTYRQRLQQVILNAYPNSTSKKDFPVVKLELNHIVFDIVPAYTDKNWYEQLYYIPGSQDNWQHTIPNDINQPLQEMNQSYGNNIVRNTIRLCKYWNASAGYPFESYLMEKRIVNTIFWWGGDLCQKFLNTLENIASDRPGVRQTLDRIRKHTGDGWTAVNQEKQLEWLQKLLPGLK